MLYVFTGDGKGKTTAAVGSLIRGYGAGFACAIIFFDKTSERCSELNALLELGIHVYIFGKDRTANNDNEEGAGFRFENKQEDYVEAKKALDKAYELSKGVDFLVLDEFLNVFRVGLIPINQVLDFIEQFPKEKYLILTGRGLSEEIADRADLISEIQNIKHPFEQGVGAEKGIEY